MEYVLQRDGESPLVFEGKILSESIGDRSFHHAHDLRIYELPSGKLVLEIIYTNTYPSRTQIHPNHFYAYVCKTPELVKQRLKSFRSKIDEVVVGPPPGSLNGKARRDALIRKILGEYDTQVSQLLDHEIFAEEVT